MLVSLYRSYTGEAEFLELNTVLKIITDCSELKKTTLSIQRKHRNSIIDDFNTTSKNSYQRDKKQLPFVCFAGNVHRETNHLNNNYIDIGLMCLDMDGKNEMPLPDQRKLLNSLPYCHSSGLSVSGAFTGAFWCNIAIETPKHLEAFKSLSKDAKQAIGFNDNLNYFNACNKLRKLFYRVIKHQFKHKKNIDAGGKGRNCSDPRYLTHDPTLFVNPDFKYFTIEQATGYYFDAMKGSRAGAINRNNADSINTNDAFEFCSQYANNAGYTLTVGHIHDFSVQFSIAANLLGIPEQETSNYLNSISPKRITTNAIKYPYEKYGKSFGLWAYRLKKGTKTIINLKPGQYIKDLNLNLDDCLLNGGCGIGKSSAQMESDDKIIKFCPNNVLIQNLDHRYPDACLFYARTRQTASPILHKQNKIITNVQNVKSIISVLGEKCKNYKAVIDESHYLSTATGKNFMYDDYSFLIDNLHRFKSCLLMTGTPVYFRHPYFKDFRTIQINSSRAKKTATIYHCADILYKAAIIANKAARKGKKVLILLDSKGQERAKLQTYLSQKYIVISADDKPDFLKDGILPDDTNIYICTSAMSVGNDIKNNSHFEFIFIGHNHHHSTKEQFSQRARNAKTAHVHILKGKESLKPIFGLSPERLGEKLIKGNEKILPGLNFNYKNKVPGFTSEMRIRNIIKTLHVKMGENGFEVDYLHINNEVIRAETMHEYYSNDYLKAKLEHYGFVFTDNVICNGLPGKKAKQAAKNAAKEHTGNVKNDYDLALDLISEQADPERYCKAKVKAGTTPAEKLAIRRYLLLSGKIINPITICKEIGIAKKEFSSFCNQLDFQNYLKSDSYKMQKTDISIFCNCIENEFKDKNLLPEQIKDKFICCLIGANFSRDIIREYEKKHDNRSIIGKLKNFFDIQRKTIRFEGGTGKEYRFVYWKWDVFIINKPISSTQFEKTLKKRLFSNFSQSSLF